MKKVIYYKQNKDNFIQKGLSAFIYPIDHPDVANGVMARTSTVKSYDESTGDFETRNTIYKLEQTND